MHLFTFTCFSLFSSKTIDINTMYCQNPDNIPRLTCNNSNIIKIVLVRRVPENNAEVFETCGYQKISWFLGVCIQVQQCNISDRLFALQVNHNSKRYHLPSCLDLGYSFIWRRSWPSMTDQESHNFFN